MTTVIAHPLMLWPLLLLLLQPLFQNDAPLGD
jgi:hypothetical protein